MTGPTLVDFLTARLDEDEADLRESNISDMPEWWAPAAWSRARGLADVKAKRAIMELADEATGLDLMVDSDRAVGFRDLSTEPYLGDVMLRHLASVYADHADFREEWRV
jgi:hypothetical protein